MEKSLVYQFLLNDLCTEYNIKLKFQKNFLTCLTVYHAHTIPLICAMVSDNLSYKGTAAAGIFRHLVRHIEKCCHIFCFVSLEAIYKMLSNSTYLNLCREPIRILKVKLKIDVLNKNISINLSQLNIEKDENHCLPLIFLYGSTVVCLSWCNNMKLLFQKLVYNVL